MAGSLCNSLKNILTDSPEHSVPATNCMYAMNTFVMNALYKTSFMHFVSLLPQYLIADKQHMIYLIAEIVV